MARTASGAILTILEALEPEALVAWEAEEVNLVEAIALSQAITDRRATDIAADANTVAIRSLDTVVQETLPGTVRATYDPDYVVP